MPSMHPWYPGAPECYCIQPMQVSNNTTVCCNPGADPVVVIRILSPQDAAARLATDLYSGGMHDVALSGGQTENLLVLNR